VQHQSNSGRGTRFLSSPKHPDQIWGPCSLLFTGNWFSQRGKAAVTWCWPQLYLIQMLRIPIYLHGLHRDKFTFYPCILLFIFSQIQIVCFSKSSKSELCQYLWNYTTLSSIFLNADPSTELGTPPWRCRGRKHS
jgi:hypothetical protein